MIPKFGLDRPLPYRYGMCVDVNECAADPEACDRESETCVNLPGRHRCMCRWGFAWSPDRQRCVPDAAVKRAEIRSVAQTLIAAVKCPVPTSPDRHHSDVFHSVRPPSAHWIAPPPTCVRYDFTVTLGHGHNPGREFNALTCFFLITLYSKTCFVSFITPSLFDACLKSWGIYVNARFPGVLVLLLNIYIFPNDPI